jgi:hypothetical protein
MGIIVNIKIEENPLVMNPAIVNNLDMSLTFTYSVPYMEPEGCLPCS